MPERVLSATGTMKCRLDKRFDSLEHHHECDFLVYNCDAEPRCFLFGEDLHTDSSGYCMRCEKCMEEYP